MQKIVSSGTWTNATLIAVIKSHIQNEVTHYKGQCYAWDVVNEAFNDDGTYRTDVFFNTVSSPLLLLSLLLKSPDWNRIHSHRLRNCRHV